ncbi:Hypothetical protein PBC10988_39140 [Planctomycetales bacterium 10988]|nr:Hypothetical protein PBC10988_39140 [Planctomycetales bacterium 10988]
MFIRPCTLLLTVLGVVSLLSSTGCHYHLIWGGPEFGPATFPTPVSPYFQDRKEDEFWVHERYERVPILGPVTAGGPPRALDPPTPDEVIRALPSIEGGLPFLWEKQRNNVRMVIEPVADYVDPPRVYPLIGPAQHHHAHYKCTVFCSEVTRNGWPLPHTLHDQEVVHVVYIDHNHLHMVGDVSGGGNYP